MYILKNNRLKFFVEPHMTPGKVYEWSELKKKFKSTKKNDKRATKKVKISDG